MQSVLNLVLMNRKQFVEINNIKSKEGNISCGVPQGSILGLLLFLIYVNDMENCLDCDFYLYTDYSASVFVGFCC